MDNLLFQKVCRQIVHLDYQRNSIGILNEKTLHAVLKHYFEPHPENHEIKLGEFVADIVGENGIIEIQTRNFSSLNQKLRSFLEVCSVTVVYPLAAVKWICWIDPQTGLCSKRRKSPKSETVFDSFWELAKIRSHLNHPNFHFCTVSLELEEYRYLNGWSPDKKRGASRIDRIPLSLIEQQYFQRSADYLKLFSKTLPEQFTAKEFAQIHQIQLNRAQSLLYTLRETEAISLIGKRNRAFLYQWNPSQLSKTPSDEINP